jgi:(p)ppGpp synthase/HD superfamily hydrolase
MTRNIGGESNVALAEAIARWAHTGQVDKNGYDYIDHPRAVFYRIYADDAEDYDGQIVAWLHDVCEDTNTKPTALANFFPPYIINAIAAITYRAFNLAETRDEYYVRVKANPIAHRVKLHDIAHNTSPKRMDKLDAETRDRLKKKYAHALEVLGA